MTGGYLVKVCYKLTRVNYGNMSLFTARGYSW